MRGKILLIDDHEVVRIGIQRMLKDTDFEIVAESSTADNLVEQITSSTADLLLMDVMIDATNAFEQVEIAKKQLPDFPIVMMSAFDNPNFVRRAIDLKVAGYVLKTGGINQLVESLRNSMQNQTTWSGEGVRRATGANSTSRLNFDTEVALTKRESEVLLQVVRGLTNKQIALELGISYETVKEHVQHLLRKIGVSDRTQAAVWAVRKGLA